ncbi:FAD-binding domain-containing protein [Laetiporus sulphureus 93-53]|uniref:FAD-binding domain-containing protein n=1 Tax=Laetiporus sulphureus 93-53 TaxID=1314785 RepID=A0A165H369_9APHY|nr:FAD-binding domain-containing protein [Laetiporus sulphureus 93-53]KZT11181.1 FAD-binding domain-containing protein [Laetiporus sulphureus 93-53]
MAMLFTATLALSALFPSGLYAGNLLASDTVSVCEEIASAISSASAVYYPLQLEYIADNFHWASSSSQNSTCSVEPGTAEDVGTILQILGEAQTAFGVKGAGHASNPGFSSTAGVEIALTRFNETVYDSATGTATIGAGMIWDDVYSALEAYGVNVVGGRVSGVGVAGFILGGGYSYLSNQYGLTIDTVTAFELVLPNGTVTNVTSASYPDLFFALKGGFNNYGIVTRFTLEAFTQGEVWVCIISFSGGFMLAVGEAEAIAEATANFYANVTDPKAAIITSFNYDLGIYVQEVSMFYDAPTPPDGIFDDFLAIPFTVQDIETRSFLSVVLATPDDTTETYRGFFNTVSLWNVTLPILSYIMNETTFWYGELSSEVPGLFISYDVEPFLPSVFSHGTVSAWPPSRAEGLLPLNIYYAWWDSSSDSLINDAMQESANYLTQMAVAEGQEVADVSLYPNYAIYDTSVSRIYGDNLARLQSIKAEYDSEDVMGLAGGWKITA